MSYVALIWPLLLAFAIGSTERAASKSSRNVPVPYVGAIVSFLLQFNYTYNNAYVNTFGTLNVTTGRIS